MNLTFNLFTLIAVYSVLSACDGGSGGLGAPVRTTAFAIADEPQLLAESPGADLVISEVQMGEHNTASSITSIPFELVLSNLAGSIDINEISLALEYSKSADFSTTYRSALVDLRQTPSSSNNSESISITARGFAADLPSGGYLGRVVINPDWNLYFDSVQQQASYGQPFYFVAETDYSNNNSSTFAIEVSSDVVCNEDSLETANELAAATKLASGGLITASLCEDNSDLYAVDLPENSFTTLKFTDLDDTGERSGYLIITPEFTTLEKNALTLNGTEITINAENAGTYYIALYGARTSYQVSRDRGASLTKDWFFSADTVDGPISWEYGQIVLNRLTFDQQTLIHQTANCSNFVTETLDGEGAAYTTPLHFSGNHEFHYLDAGSYTVDGDIQFNWQVVQGDISHQNWYVNPYLGWAENIGGGGFRYWQFDGLSYVECFLG